MSLVEAHNALSGNFSVRCVSGFWIFRFVSKGTQCSYWILHNTPMAPEAAPANKHTNISMAKHMIVSSSGINRLAPYDFRLDFAAK